MYDISYNKECKPYNVLASVFNSTLLREKEIVDDYWTKERMRVFFRSNKNTNEQGAKAQLYYMPDEGIKEGALVDIKDKVYIALNQSTIENDIYKKSDLFECNVNINTFSNGYEVNIPGYCYYLTSVFGNDYPQISVVGGNMEVITQDCEVSRLITPNSTFIDLGATWRVEDCVIRNGLMHYYIQKQADTLPPDFKVEILSRAVEFESGKMERFEISAQRKEHNDSTWNTVENATIWWKSSNEGVVCFDGNGTARFGREGTATITALWREHGVTDSIEIIVTAETLPKYEISYKGNPEIKSGGSAKSFTANFGFVEDSGFDIIPIWHLELTPEQEEKITYTIDNVKKTISIKAQSGAPFGTTFNLWLTTNDYLTSTGEQVKARIEVNIISLF
ncbi:MAG: hypothetical protein LBS21_09440 [Clostridiales bacterium]|jgi:hypothetical protein|nr:hypothetical protein [Clostridiales bacterium]